MRKKNSAKIKGMEVEGSGEVDGEPVAGAEGPSSAAAAAASSGSDESKEADSSFPSGPSSSGNDGKDGEDGEDVELPKNPDAPNVEPSSSNAADPSSSDGDADGKLASDQKKRMIPYYLSTYHRILLSKYNLRYGLQSI
jgi:hypothetical protein